MKGSSIVMILFLYSSVVDANTYFQIVGRINSSPSYGHVHLTIDLNRVETHLDNMFNTLKDLYFKAVEFRQPHISARCQKFLINTKEELKILKERMQDYNLMTDLSPQESRRVKRFLGAIAIGIATTSLAIGIGNTAAIIGLKSSLSDVVTRQHHITDILQEHEVSIHNVQHNLDVVKSSVMDIANHVIDSDMLQKFLEAEITITKAMQELTHMVDCIILGTERLFMHRLPLCFTNTTNLFRAHERLTRDAWRKDLVPVQPNIAAYLRYEVSTIIKDKKIHIFVHVPLTNEKHNMQLLRFYSLPIPISPSLHMKVEIKQQFLAISNDGLHTALDKSVIDTAYKFGELHFPKFPLILKKNLQDSCLGSIYQQNYTNLQQKCPVVFFQLTEMVEVFKPNTLMFYTNKPQTIRITCPDNKHQQHFAVESQQQIVLNKGCRASSNMHVFRAGYDLSVDDDIQRWPTIWNISDVLFEVDAKTLERVVQRLNLLDTNPTAIRDVKKMVWMDTHAKYNFGISMTLLVISVIVFIILGYFLYRFIMLKRQSMSSDRTNSQEIPK